MHSRVSAFPEFRVLRKLNTPRKVQDFLDTIPINKEVVAETCTSPLVTLRRNTAHCMEGALLAALALSMSISSTTDKRPSGNIRRPSI